MPTAVSTPDQLHERVAGVADAAAVPRYTLSTRLTVDGTRLYASVMCYREVAAQELASALRREAVAEFGEQQGKQMTVRREGPHVQVFLPLPKPDAARGSQFLSTMVRPTTEF
jgi:hypothetical protein